MKCPADRNLASIPSFFMLTSKAQARGCAKYMSSWGGKSISLIPWWPLSHRIPYSVLNGSLNSILRPILLAGVRTECVCLEEETQLEEPLDLLPTLFVSQSMGKGGLF